MHKVFIILLILTFQVVGNSQSIDKVEAILGDEIVLTSEIESQYLQYLSEGGIKSPTIRCEVIEDLMLQKLLINYLYTRQNLKSFYLHFYNFHHYIT